MKKKPINLIPINLDSSNDCGGFKPPSGKMDSQMYPECEGYETDRNIVKKTVEKRKKKKKKAFNLKQHRLDKLSYAFGKDDERDQKRPGRGLPTLMTNGIMQKIHPQDVEKAWRRFMNADWGEIDAEDKERNDAAFEQSETAYLMGEYVTSDGEIFWIICDGRATTVLLPEEH